MIQEKYEILCKACDKILNDSNASLTTVAIPWLHIIREHPTFLSRYKNLFILKKINYIKNFFIGVKAWISNFKRLLKSISTKKSNFYTNKPFPASIDFIFITHLVNPNHVLIANDFYYGNIPLELAKKGYSVAIAYINMTEASSKILANQLPIDTLHRVIFTETICVSDEMQMLASTFKERKRLRLMARSEPPGFFRRVLLAAAREATTPGTIFSLRIGRQVAGLISKINPRSLITIHEGHSWERVVFASAREVNKTINCVAYQHAVLYRLQHAIFRPLDMHYSPNQIVASGVSSFTRLSKQFISSGVNIRLGGSVRNVKFLKKKIEQHSGKVKRCIVLPEGIIDECNILFSFALSCARLSPKTEFIFRLHPVVNLKKLKYFTIPILASAPNIRISNRSFSEDLVDCDYALYRGSSAIVQAVGSGVIPIYLNRPDELTIDPLFEVQNHQIRVSAPNDFLDVINSHKHYDLLNQETVINHCRKIYSQINIETFTDVLYPICHENFLT